MEKPTTHIYDLKEVLTALIKQNGVHEGIWVLGVEFGFGAGSFSSDNKIASPTAFAQILKIGISRVEVEGPQTVNASIINPKLKKTKKQTPSKEN
jgi:hypothetical protein